MPPDLRHTPIRIRPRRGWTIGFFLLGLAISLFDAWALVHDPTAPLRMKLELGLGPLLLLLAIFQLASPRLLEINPDGVRHSDGVLRHFYRWHEITDPRIHAVLFVIPQVVFDYAPADRRHPLWCWVRRMREGYGANLGGGWDVPAADIVALLVQAKARWG